MKKKILKRFWKVYSSLKEEFRILVVDGNSPDGTSQIIKNFQQYFPEKLYLKKLDKKNGLGKTYLNGFQWALERSYSFIFEMDSDLSHNPIDLISLKKAIKESDMVIGSRYCKGVNIVNWPMQRLLLSYFASKYVRFITGLPIYDTTSGFICYKRKVLEQIMSYPIKSSGYFSQIEIKYRAWKKGFRLHEIPIVFTGRNFGDSKMNYKIFQEAMLGVIALRFLKNT